MTRDELTCLHAKLTTDARELMQKKNQDYATGDDPFRNFRTFGRVGILVRMSDKLARLRSYCERGTFSVEDEGVEDTIIDIINYAVLFAGYGEPIPVRIMQERQEQINKGLDAGMDALLRGAQCVRGLK